MQGERTASASRAISSHAFIPSRRPRRFALVVHKRAHAVHEAAREVLSWIDPRLSRQPPAPSATPSADRSSDTRTRLRRLCRPSRGAAGGMCRLWRPSLTGAAVAACAGLLARAAVRPQQSNSLSPPDCAAARRQTFGRRMIHPETKRVLGYVRTQIFTHWSTRLSASAHWRTVALMIYCCVRAVPVPDSLSHVVRWLGCDGDQCAMVGLHRRGARVCH
jgi:hypothetical protein